MRLRLSNFVAQHHEIKIYLDENPDKSREVPLRFTTVDLAPYKSCIVDLRDVIGEVNFVNTDDMECEVTLRCPEPFKNSIEKNPDTVYVSPVVIVNDGRVNRLICYDLIMIGNDENETKEGKPNEKENSFSIHSNCTVSNNERLCRF